MPKKSFPSTQDDTDICNTKVSITVSFEPVILPPFKDILVIAKRGMYGLYGISKCMSLLTSNGYDVYEVDEEVIEAVLISQRIQKRIKKDEIMEILKAYVFPEMCSGDLIKVDLDVRKTIQIHKEYY